MQAACLLYNITGEQQYLNEAQQIARSAYSKWFTLYDSKELGEKFYRINGDHVWFYSVLFRGFLELYKTNSSWQVLHEGAFVEMLARLAVLELEGK